MDSWLLTYKHTRMMLMTGACVSLIIFSLAETDGLEVIQRRFEKSVAQFSFNVSVQEKTRVASPLYCVVQCRQLEGCLAVSYQRPTSSCTKYRLLSSTEGPPATPGADVWFVTASHKYIGCFVDGRGHDRVLQVNVTLAGMTTEMCKLICINYSHFGTEYGTECFCGDVINKASKKVSNWQCNMACEGDPSTKCGARWRISVYQLKFH